MKKFAYSLESVLRVKSQIQENTKEQLRQAISLLRKEEENVRRLELRKKSYQEKKEQYARGGVEPPTLLLFDSYIRKIKREIKEAQARVAEAEARVDNLKVALLKITQECDMLKKLKEKEFAAYKKELSRHEQKLIDEIGARSY